MPDTTMTCICGHADDEHDQGVHACAQCDCETFNLGTGNDIDYNLRDWGEE